MYVSEKRLAANRRNIELGREKAHETWHRIKERNQQLVECTATCEHCHKVFNKLIKQIDLDKNRLPRFCSRSCANSRIRTPEIKAKVSKTLCGTKTVGGKRIEISPVICKGCGKIIPGRRTHRRYCSAKCRWEHNHHINKSGFDGTIRQYREACKFTFGLRCYPDEFDFALVKQYGWYSPKNKKNNPNGVTRDHMYSVREGYVNKVDPYLISHPANCKLMLHLDNTSKNRKCSITLDELLKRINSWEQKYGKYKPPYKGRKSNIH